MTALTVDEARARILNLAVLLPAETVALDEVAGRVLAEDITAIRDQPPFDASAMDGWAVRLGDQACRIVGESAAGRGYGAVLQAGEAVRISTGAPVPKGAEAVVIQEKTVRDGAQVRFAEAPSSGDNIRKAGGDFSRGEALLRAGDRLDPWRIALVAAAGVGAVPVVRRPRVAILSSGDELATPGTEPGPWQIFNSGGPALAALARSWGAEAPCLPKMADDEDATVAAVQSADCDVLVTIGGASVGDHDVIKPALARLGLKIAVPLLRMRPGKPMWFGTLADGRRALGLPGNPASAMVCAELFLRPLMAAMQGARTVMPAATARLSTDMPANGPREHWMRAALSIEGSGLIVTPFPDQDSSLVTRFAAADALLKRAIDAPPARAGDLVDVIMLERAR